MISIRVCVHNKYVTTEVKIARVNTLDYVTFGLVGHNAPSQAFTCATKDELRDWCVAYRAPDFDIKDVNTCTEKGRAIAFTGFEAWFEIDIVFHYEDDFSKFTVEKCEYTSPRVGRNNLVRAFEKDELKRGMVANIFNLIQANDAGKLTSILDALKSAFV